MSVCPSHFLGHDVPQFSFKFHESMVNAWEIWPGILNADVSSQLDLVTVCSFLSFWQHFKLVKQAKIVISGHFLENSWEEWPKI